MRLEHLIIKCWGIYFLVLIFFLVVLVLDSRSNLSQLEPVPSPAQGGKKQAEGTVTILKQFRDCFGKSTGCRSG